MAEEERWRGGIDYMAVQQERRLALLEEHIKESVTAQADLAKQVEALKATVRVVVVVAVPTLAIVINLLLR